MRIVSNLCTPSCWLVLVGKENSARMVCDNSSILKKVCWSHNSSYLHRTCCDMVLEAMMEFRMDGMPFNDKKQKLTALKFAHAS